MEIILIGVGEVVKKYWESVFTRALNRKQIVLRGIIDPRIKEINSPLRSFGAWEALGTDVIPRHYERIADESVIFVCTPDHFPVIAECAEIGYRNFIVEKPLVKESDIAGFETLATRHGLRTFACDHYIPKVLRLQALEGVITVDDPRHEFLPDFVSSFAQWRKGLGELEGITVSIIESGDFALPDIASRPWLADPVRGGMLNDLATHGFAPLFAARLLGEDAQVLAVDLYRIADDDSSLVRLTHRGEAEMYTSVQLRCNDVPIHAAFGKVPGKGGSWSLCVRYQHGQYVAGLRSGELSAIWLGDEFFPRRPKVSPHQIMLHEASLFFHGHFPADFDGYVGASLGALRLNKKIREHFFASAAR